MSAALSYQTPYESAQHFVDWLRDPLGRPTLIRWRGSFYTWTGTHYRPMGEEELRAQLYRFLNGSLLLIPPNDGSGQFTTARFVPNDTRVNKIMHALKAQVLVLDDIEPPSWREPPRDPSMMAGDVVACANGLLHLPSRALLDHTPHFFNLNALGFDYDPNAPQPAEWLKFLASLWPSDPASIAALEEIIGYMISGRTDLQKIFLLIGPRRSGRGTILRVMTALLGSDNVAAPTLTGLRSEFGLAPLIGKMAAFVTDARLDLTRREIAVIVECLLRISGEDQVQVNRKHVSHWNGRLPVRFMIASNEVPNLVDASGAIAGRFVPLRFRESFFGREDTGLQSRLQAELPGIFNRALDSLDSLNKRGRFVIPRSAQSIADQLADLASILQQFGADCCELGRGYWSNEATLYAEYRHWAEEAGLRPVSKSEFVRQLCAAFSTVDPWRPRNVAGRPRRVKGIRLRPGATAADRLDAAFGKRSRTSPEPVPLTTH